MNSFRIVELGLSPHGRVAFFAETIGLTVQSGMPVHSRLTLGLGDHYNIKEDKAPYTE